MKKKYMGMRLQQALSFAPIMMKVSGRGSAEAVFWPGCALMKLDPVILDRTMDALRGLEPDIRLCTACCSQPTRYLFPEKLEGRRKQLLRLLKKRGVRRIYTSCPNCEKELRDLWDFEVIPIWTVLSEEGFLSTSGCEPEDDQHGATRCGPEERPYSVQKHSSAKELAGATEDIPRRVILHDPCPLRDEPAQLDNIRRLIKARGIEVIEPEHSGARTLCCGNKHMLRSRDPKKASAIRKRRISEFEPGIPVVGCCEGCLDAFRSEGIETIHILEILFGRSSKRSWINRFHLSFRG